jgi:2-haloacid dehalogenase
MSPRSLYVFDAYGTLLDVASAVAKHAERIGPDAARLNELWRAKQLEYSWVHALMGEYRPFWALTERALDHAMARVPSVPAELRVPLLAAYRELGAYADAAPTLAALRAQGKRTAVLSNGNQNMLEAAFAAAGLTPLLDALLSVEDAKTFKTSAAAYNIVLQRMDANAGDVCFVSSNRWDVAGAARFGFDTVWVNRAGLPDEYPDYRPGRVLKSLAELAR